MRMFEASQWLDVAVEPIWQHMCDVVRWPEWIATFTEVAALDSRELRLHSRYRVTQPKLRTAVWTVTLLEPPTRFMWQSRMPGLLMVADHLIQPATSGSQITLRVSFEGPLSAVLGVLFGGLGQRYLQQECASYEPRLRAAAAASVQ